MQLADQLTERHARELLALLLLIPVSEDVMSHDTLYVEFEPDSRLSEFLYHDGFVGEDSFSTVFFGDVG